MVKDDLVDLGCLAVTVAIAVAVATNQQVPFAPLSALPSPSTCRVESIVSNWPAMAARSQVAASVLFSLSVLTLLATLTLWAGYWHPLGLLISRSRGLRDRPLHRDPAASASGPTPSGHSPRLRRPRPNSTISTADVLFNREELAPKDLLLTAPPATETRGHVATAPGSNLLSVGHLAPGSHSSFGRWGSAIPTRASSVSTGCLPRSRSSSTWGWRFSSSRSAGPWPSIDCRRSD